MYRVLLLVSCSVMVTTLAAADVRVEAVQRMQVAGQPSSAAAMGDRKTTIWLKGNRRMIADQYAAELVDLDAEVIYRLDLRGKRFMKVPLPPAPAAPEASAGPYFGVPGVPGFVPPEIVRKATGQRRQIGGYDCQEVVTSMTVSTSGRTFVTRVTEWLTMALPHAGELEAFQTRYEQRVGRSAAATPALVRFPWADIAADEIGDVPAGGTSMLTIMAMGDGAPLLNEGRDSQATSDKKKSRFGGITGAFGRNARRNRDDDRTEPIPTTTMEFEILTVSPEVSDADVSAPANFKEQQIRNR